MTCENEEKNKNVSLNLIFNEHIKLWKGISMQFKYMRIQGREESWITKYPMGIFGMCLRMIMDGVMSKEDEEFFRSIDQWFKYNLPYDVVYTNFVGTIVYEDDWQVAVAIENGEMV